eukprot:COSAG04_NODE_17939_length_455_cov_1.227528_1_plen_41_part_10
MKVLVAPDEVTVRIRRSQPHVHRSVRVLDVALPQEGDERAA